MAIQGYWAVYEEVWPTNNQRRTPGSAPMCMIHVEGFFNADVMATSQREAVLRVTKKLERNLHFLLDCYADIPAPAYSDTPPARKYPAGVTLLFIPLKDMGIEENVFESMRLAA